MGLVVGSYEQGNADDKLQCLIYLIGLCNSTAVHFQETTLVIKGDKHYKHASA